MSTVLWVIAVILVIAGIYTTTTTIFRRLLLWGIVLIVLGFLVGPGGISIFNP